MNLAETQIMVRKWIFVLLIMTVTYYVGKILLFGGLAVYKQLFPKEIPPPSAKFGKLPTLQMSSYKILGTPQYTLETEDGKLPNFGDREYVYKIIKPTPNLLAESKTKDIATTLGFTGGFIKKSISEFQWIDGQTNRTMTANVTTQDFYVKTDLSKLGSVLSTVDSITTTDAENKTLGFIKSKGLMTQAETELIRFESIPTVVNLAKYQDISNFPRQAKLVKVNVYRALTQAKPLSSNKTETIDILGPNPKHSLIAFYVTNDSEKYKFPEISFTHWDIDIENKTTYPIANIEDVWKTIKLNQGVVSYIKVDKNGYYSQYKPLNLDTIQINKIYLAYYEPKEYTEYLQPIYVFEGVFKTVPEVGALSKKGDIIIYYPAVDGNYVEQAPKTEKQEESQQKENTPKTSKPQKPISSGIN